MFFICKNNSLGVEKGASPRVAFKCRYQVEGLQRGWIITRLCHTQIEHPKYEVVSDWF